MNKNIKDTIKALIYATIIMAVVVSLTQAISSIYPKLDNADIIKITALAGNPTGYEYVDEDSIKKDVEVFYTIKVSGSPTYTFTSQEMIQVKMNLNNLNSINQSIIEEIKKKSLNKWNWSLPDNKILYQPYSKP